MSTRPSLGILLALKPSFKDPKSKANENDRTGRHLKIGLGKNSCPKGTVPASYLAQCLQVTRTNSYRYIPTEFNKLIPKTGDTKNQSDSIIRSRYKTRAYHRGHFNGMRERRVRWVKCVHQDQSLCIHEPFAYQSLRQSIYREQHTLNFPNQVRCYIERGAVEFWEPRHPRRKVVEFHAHDLITSPTGLTCLLNVQYEQTLYMRIDTTPYPPGTQILGCVMALDPRPNPRSFTTPPSPPPTQWSFPNRDLNHNWALTPIVNLLCSFVSRISRFISDAPPTHYTVKIQLFSLLTKNSIERYESGEFEAGGYKWKLVLYPSGNKSKNVKDHISLYLALHGATAFHSNTEIYVNFRLFLLDQNNDNYLVIQDTFGKERRFTKTKVEWGFDQFISLKDFNDGSNGHLVNDVCTLGAEVFVCKERSQGKGEFLVLKDDIAYKHVWTIDNFFSKLDSGYLVSIPFDTGNYKWIIKLYPKGKHVGLDNNYLSLYLALINPTTFPPGSKICTHITLRILDQKYGNHYSGKANYWITASSWEIGFPRFVLLSSVTNYYGYVVNGICLVDAEVKILATANELS
ncbi:Ubiquitin carboxyl-terminal hydrolase 12 [Spatholobus suberectus]|nr:Ubiquitin carboxyl-terminal hydrolase 12 [Spatholobus suberectus]